MLSQLSAHNNPANLDLDGLLDLFKQLDIAQIKAMIDFPFRHDWKDMRQQFLTRPGEADRYTEEGDALAREADAALMRTRNERTWPGWYAVGPLTDRGADLLLAQRHRDAISNELWGFVMQPWKDLLSQLS